MCCVTLEICIPAHCNSVCPQCTTLKSIENGSRLEKMASWLASTQLLVSHIATSRATFKAVGIVVRLFMVQVAWCHYILFRLSRALGIWPMISSLSTSVENIGINTNDGRRMFIFVKSFCQNHFALFSSATKVWTAERNREREVESGTHTFQKDRSTCTVAATYSFKHIPMWNIWIGPLRLENGRKLHLNARLINQKQPKIFPF